MDRKFSRRALVLAAGGTMAAQTQPAPLPATPDAELESARNGLKAAAAQIAKVPVPMSTEPAVHFKA
jgi:hypothetical protein